ncbi:peptide ABC transporter substrate-binding protein [Candidatus Peregrinibacteria bacterium]|nr:peptide ABC transporter substrate-binding protein [Candidatus Peregrinibacteria bacterium]
MLAVSLIILIIISLINILRAEPKNDLETTNPENQTELPQEGGAYSEGLIGSVKRLNPLFTEFNNVDRDISNLVFSGLSKYDPLKGEVVEDLATHTLSVDKKTYTFNIKKNVFWHDENPLTAEDVYFTYHEIIQHPDFKNPILKSNFQGIEIKLIDKNTITFTLNEPNAFFFTNTTLGILPKHILKDVPVAELEKHEFNNFPIGSGPFKVEGPIKTNVNGQNEVFLTRFDKYYGEKAFVKELKFFTYVSEEAMFKERKELNGLSKITDQNYLQILNESKHYQLIPYTLPQYTAIFFNMESTIIKNGKVRLALLKAIEKEKLIQKLGLKKRIDTPLLELDQENWIYQYSKEEAMGALYDAGWRYKETEKGISKIRENADNMTLTLRLLTSSFETNKSRQEENEKTIEFIKQSLEEIGVHIIVETLKNEELEQKIREGKYDLLLSGQGMGYNLDTYSFWHSSQGNGIGLNLSNYKSPIADNLIEAIRTTFNPEVKKEKLKNLAKTIATDVPAIFLYTPVYYYVIDFSIKNIQITSLSFPSDRLTNITKWYIKEKKS